MSRFDAHIHLFERGFGRDRAVGAELDEYLGLARAADVAAALVVGYEGAGFAGNNDYIRDSCREHPELVPLAYLELGGTRAASQGDVEEALADGFRGFSLYLSDATIVEAADAGVWSAIRDSSAILSVNAPSHVWGALRSWTELIERPVLVSHLGLPGPPAPGTDMASAMSPVVALAESPRVHVKLSGAYAIDAVVPHRAARPAVDAVLAAFGSERVCWGSDYSPAVEVVGTRDLFTLPAGVVGALSSTELEGVLGGNLRRVLAEAS